jgi:trigger factor
MQVTQTRADGLRREFQVVLPATELEERLTSELATLKDRVQLKGFRPGKVPVAHLRRVYGRSVMADVVQNAVNEANRKIVDENGLKLAMEPQVAFPEDKDAVAKAMDAKADLSFTVAVEVLPSFELADVSDVSVTKEVARVEDEEVDRTIEGMAAQNRPYRPKGEDAEAAAGDRVVLDYSGKIDGQPFEGGSAEGATVEIGSGSFIPGFEEQLVGARAGESRTVAVTFPESYPAEHLAGKAAVFDVSVKEVEVPGEVVVDDALAESFGMESLDKLRDAVRATIQRDYDAQSRRKLKKALLDALDAKYTFEIPQALVDQEFAGVWSQVEADLKRTGKTFADENTTEEAARAEYRRIAERRVRLGLVLAQAGERADIKVSDDELTQAIIRQARQFPGQEKQLWELYRKNPNAVAAIRAPLFEEKVVDHMLSQVTVVEEPVSKEALFKDDDDETAGEPA